MLSEYCKEFYSCSGQLQLLAVPGPLAPHTLKSGGARAHPEYMAPAPMQRTFNKKTNYLQIYKFNIPSAILSEILI